MDESAHTVWTLQRTALMRARRVIFSGILDLGGPPTCVEEERQLAEDARVGACMAGALRRALAEDGAGDLLAPLPCGPREWWEARAPALLAFGARTHGELVRLARRASEDPRAERAAAVFQLAASLLDWIGDEDGGADDVRRWVSRDTLERMTRDAAAGRELAARARSDGRPASAAFVTLLALLIDLVRALPGDGERFFAQLSIAYGAELASFDPPSSATERLAIARRKSVAPTAVVGEIARLTVAETERDVVGRAVATIAGVFSVIDDVADLSADLRAGALNTLVAEADVADEARDDDGVARALRTVLATDVVERRAADVAASVRDLARTLDDARVEPSASRAALEWLRLTTWRWIA